MSSHLPTGTYDGAEAMDAAHGHNFERYLLMLFGFRGLQRGYEYSMATELKDAGKFDDVVFHLIRDDGQLCTRLLQAKHLTSQNREITVEDMLDKNSRFNLTKYFESYMQTQDNFT